MALRKLELTLAILKPDLTARPQQAHLVKKLALDDGFLFVRSKQCRVSLADAHRFYREHSDKYFFHRLTSYLTSGPISVHLMARENAIRRWRELQGPTRPFTAKIESPNSIRARFGLTDTRNSTHGSDSPNSVHRETAFFFEDFSVESWLKFEEPFFRNKDQLTFDPETWQHSLKDPLRKPQDSIWAAL